MTIDIELTFFKMKVQRKARSQKRTPKQRSAREENANIKRMMSIKCT